MMAIDGTGNATVQLVADAHAEKRAACSRHPSRSAAALCQALLKPTKPRPGNRRIMTHILVAGLCGFAGLGWGEGWSARSDPRERGWVGQGNWHKFAIFRKHLTIVKRRGLFST